MGRWLKQTPRPLWSACGLTIPVALAALEDSPKWATPRAIVAGVQHETIRSQTVCVGHTGAFDGQIGDTLAYRYHQEGERLRVSYFAYWSSESPWGDEPLPVSLVVDGVYSHLLFALPGLQYLLYGPADIEGATVEYITRTQGRGEVELIPIAGHAEDTNHRSVALDSDELRGPNGATWLLTNGWSHQLGAPNAASWASKNSQHSAEGSYRCFSGAQLVPLTERLASDFRLGSESEPLRAKPAWL